MTTTIRNPIQEATIRDIPLLAVHHRKMFAEIWEQKGQQLDPDTARQLETAYTRKLKEQIPAKTCKVWLIMDGCKCVASGGVSMLSFVPVPADLNSEIGFIHSIFTEKEFRGRKYARRILDKALEFCRQNGIKRVFLNASEAGRPIYEKIGFSPSRETMIMLLNKKSDNPLNTICCS